MGAVENPAAPPLEYRVERARIKADAGARFLQLQICYRPERLEAFLAGLGYPYRNESDNPAYRLFLA